MLATLIEVSANDLATQEMLKALTPCLRKISLESLRARRRKKRMDTPDERELVELVELPDNSVPSLRYSKPDNSITSLPYSELPDNSVSSSPYSIPDNSIISLPYSIPDNSTVSLPYSIHSSPVVTSPRSELAKLRPATEFSRSQVQRPITELDLDLLALDLLDTEVFQSCLDLRRPSISGIQDDFLYPLPKIFRSLCLCDLNSSGYPVILRSKFFTNAPRGLKDFPEDISDGFELPECIISDRPGTNGRPRFILQFFQGLVSRETTSIPFVLAAQMDITDNLRNLTAELIPLARRSSTSPAPTDGTFGIDWVAAATEPASTTTVRPPLLSTSMQPLANFHDYIKDLAFFHRDAFVLTPAKRFDFGRPLSTISLPAASGHACWQVSYASPHLAAHEADLEAALAMTDPVNLMELAEQLARGRPVAMHVRWGVEGEDRWMYCIPMIRGAIIEGHLAFLLDFSVGNLWALERS